MTFSPMLREKYPQKHIFYKYIGVSVCSQCNIRQQTLTQFLFRIPIYHIFKARLHFVCMSSNRQFKWKIQGTRDISHSIFEEGGG